jgi:predicted KAP-like P-loop ATPase
MHRDINELQNKMDSMEAKLDIKMDSMEAKLDTKMDSMEAKLDTKIDGLKGEIMEVLKNFVTEKTPESENASHEIHDVDTRKVNQEWRNSNFGLKTNHVPKIDMRKFDGRTQSHGYFRWSNSLISIMCHIHKRYELLLYI